ncbi:hypothetical protein [Halomonas korlensis]|uniref:Uncharacterized protein n=1 Tax=Halomonas korlensis TaxID=463301 RepID=A0A1I7J3L7_9GAMM|nr:hypothetical protein [Halomonas korlensis]SFU79727.1 hypothetical protein SAMN04487955_10934 [Halomonas korlensis]
MPDELSLMLDPQLEIALQEVCDQEGLESLDQAAEWLTRRRLRKGTVGLTGRGRALYDINDQGGRR